MALTLASLVLQVPGDAAAQTLPGGSIHLAWDDCYNSGLGGVIDKQFACDADAAEPFMLVASAFPPQGIQQYAGTTSVLGFQYASSPMPDWWSFGQCQPANAITALAPDGSSTCPDVYVAQHFGGWSFEPRYAQPNLARLRAGLGIDPAATGPVGWAQEAVVVRIRINGRRVVGTSACSGCAVPLCITFQSLRIDQTDPDLPVGLVTSGEQQSAYWNNRSGAANCYTPVEPRTWGQLKSLYR